MTDKPRSIEKTIEIEAPVEAVWKALTDAEELTRWFPLQAEVTPGAGGAITAAWGNEYKFTTPIDAWEPERHLRLMYAPKTPDPAPGEPEPKFRIPYDVAVDYYLEADGNRTILRLVHSGFAADAAWDDQYDATSSGWTFQLAGMKHYLEHHRGVPRRAISFRVKLGALPLTEAWSRVMGDQGLGIGTPNGRFDLTAASNLRLAGDVQLFRPGRELMATVASLNNGFLRIHLDDLPIFRARDVHFQLSTFGLPDDELRQTADAFDTMFRKLFPDCQVSRVGV